MAEDGVWSIQDIFFNTRLILFLPDVMVTTHILFFDLRETVGFRTVELGESCRLKYSDAIGRTL